MSELFSTLEQGKIQGYWFAKVFEEAPSLRRQPFWRALQMRLTSQNRE
jgi:hypothetical protein